MTIKNTFIVATKAIMTNKVRSFLTMLGVIIGVFSVAMLTSIGYGLQSYISDQFESMGSNNVVIYPGDIFGEDGGFDQEAQMNAFANNKLKLRDVYEIEKIKEYVQYVVPFNSVADEVSYRDKSKKTSVIGTNFRYQDIMEVISENGRFFNKDEDRSGKKVAVIGHSIAEDLFGSTDPIGKKIKMGNQSFVVVGVADEKGSGIGGPSFDTYIYIPLKAAQKAYDKDDIVEIVVKAKDKDKMPETINAIEEVMLKRLDEDEFSVFDQSEILETITQILNMFTIGLGGIAAISLLVGGIGIMNIMLVSVTERTREIGLRKALGATPNQILFQFLIEAALLSIIGGLIGLVLAYLGSALIQPYFPAKITLDSVLLAFGVSTAVGLIFGAAPARSASRLSPIEALRYE